MDKSQLFKTAKSNIIDLFQDRETKSTDDLKEIIGKMIDAFPEYNFIDKQEMYIHIRLEQEIDINQNNTALLQKEYEPWLYESGKPTDPDREELNLFLSKENNFEPMVYLHPYEFGKSNDFYVNREDLKKYTKKISLKEIKELFSPEDLILIRKGNRLSVIPIIPSVARKLLDILE